MTPPDASTAAARRAVRSDGSTAARRPHTGSTARFRRPSAAAPPRRISGPGRHAGHAPKRGGAVLPARARRALRAIAALPDLAFVDRVVRGRAWIAVVGTLLIGIVALQVSMLGLNAGIGRAVERSSALERDNARLEATVAGMASAKRVRAKAQKLGLVTPQMERVRYVPARTGPEASAALAALASGAFDPAVLARKGADGEGMAGNAPGAGADGTSAASGDISPEEAQAMLSDGDPANDKVAMLSDGNPDNDTEAALSDGDPSNDADALLSDGDPSNDGDALLSDGDPSNDGEVASTQSAADGQ